MKKSLKWNECCPEGRQTDKQTNKQMVFITTTKQIKEQKWRKFECSKWWSMKYVKQWNGQYKIMDSNGMANREVWRKKTLRQKMINSIEQNNVQHQKQYDRIVLQSDWTMGKCSGLWHEACSSIFAI